MSFNTHIHVKKCRKTYRCDECGGYILKGASYRKIVGTSDGEFYHMKACLHCADAMDYLRAQGYSVMSGQAQSDAEYYQSQPELHHE